MTLEEWMDRLPETHRARKEYEALKPIAKPSRMSEYMKRSSKAYEKTIPDHGDLGGPLCCIVAKYEDGTEISFGHEVMKQYTRPTSQEAEEEFRQDQMGEVPVERLEAGRYLMTVPVDVRPLIDADSPLRVIFADSKPYPKAEWLAEKHGAVFVPIKGE
jgi:hypothetical protein